MQIIDISREISCETAVYPGDDPVVLERPWRIGPDSPVNMSRLGCTTHTATHLDAPFHVIETGETLDALPLERFILPARVISISQERIGPEVIPDRSLAEGCALLFKMQGGAGRYGIAYDNQHVHVDPEAAGLAVERGAVLVGVESLSVDPCGAEALRAHRALLGKGVLILEGLDLQRTEPGCYTLIALPLKIGHADGALVRAVLVKGWN